jgi:hypothetical protein
MSSLVDGNYALITSNQRDIGGVIPNVVVEEVGTDILRITDHPVEIGATVSDHAFKMPCEVTMRCGWSDASGGFEGYSAAVYATLLQLQSARQPFTLSTGKRLYQNMLIGMIHQETTTETEHALFATVALREVILTSTQMGQVPVGNQTQPQQTAAPTNIGQQALQSNSPSPLTFSLPTFAQ